MTDPTPSKKVRKQKLVDRRLQLKLVGWFVVTAAVSLGLQYVLTVNTMAEVALQPHRDTASAFDAVVHASLRNLGVCLLITLPVVAVVAVLATFRILGPLEAMKRFLGAVQRGERDQPMVLRKGDELQELCRLVNEVTEPLREEPADDERREAA